MKTETYGLDEALLKEIDAMHDTVTISKKARYLRWTRHLLTSGTAVLNRLHGRKSSHQSDSRKGYTEICDYEHLKSRSRQLTTNMPATPFG
jgi:hypothetical protein